VSGFRTACRTTLPADHAGRPENRIYPDHPAESAADSAFFPGPQKWRNLPDGPTDGRASSSQLSPHNGPHSTPPWTLYRR